MRNQTQQAIPWQRAVVLTALVLPLRLLAVPACPTPATLKQPDGTAVTIRLLGDENRHWHEDAGGYTVMKNEKGWWAYAVTNATGALAPGHRLAGRDQPEQLGLPKHLNTPRTQPLRTSAPRRVSSTAPSSGNTNTNPPTKLAATTGNLKNLVVLVQFPDLLATNTAAAFTNLFNQIGYTTDGASGSVKDFYNEVSRNRLNVDSIIADWVTVSNNYAYYGGNIGGEDQRPREMVQEALALLEARGFDFSQCDADSNGEVDGLTIIHAGGGEEYSGNDTDYIWAHQWELTTTVTYDGVSMFNYHTEAERRGFDNTPSSWGITRIGVICHETGHFLGLPDLYDTTYASAGVGDFCLMSGGSWNGDSGTLPAHPSIFCKQMLGWVTPTVVSGSGSYTVPRIEDSTNAFRINGNWPSTQYVLIENRQGYGFDAGLPGANRGLLIWHIDDAQSDNDNAAHYMVDLEEASGTQHLQLSSGEGGDDSDYYRTGNNTQFASNTTPNNLSYGNIPLGLIVSAVSASSASMTFILQGLSPTPFLTLETSTNSDTIGGNGDSVVDPGESIRLFVAWKNWGDSTASNVSATLSSGASGISLLQSSATYSNIVANATITNTAPFIYRVAKTVPAGTTIVFTNVINAGAWTFTGTISRVIGSQPSSTNSSDSIDVPKDIPDLATIYITNIVALAGSNYIDDVNVSVRLDHTYDGDLILALQHPDGTEVIMADMRGRDGQNYGTGANGSMVRTVFDDQAVINIASGSAPFAGSYCPEAMLSALNNKTVNGVWRLRITDAGSIDTGTTYAFGLTMVTHGTQWLATVFNNAPSASNQTVAASAGQTTNLVLRGSDPDSDPLTFRTNTLPLHGTLSSFNTNSGTIAYTATIGYSGTDTFSFVVHDGFTSSPPATVTLQVTTLTLTCTVVSAYGGATPGTVVTNWGASLSQWITNSPVANGASTQYVCSGATMVHHLYTQVNPTNVTLTLTNNTTLTWRWQTNFWLNINCGTNGSVTPADSWIARGSNLQVTATPAAYYNVAGWSGQTNGATFISSNQLNITMDASRSIQVWFEALLATNQTPQWWLAFYGLTNDGFNAAAMLDSDSDGVPNWAEYVAGTDPTNLMSVLKIAGLTPASVNFTPAFANRRYVVLTATNLVSPDWTPLAAYQPGTGTVTTLSATNLAPHGFYRIGVQLP